MVVEVFVENVILAQLTVLLMAHVTKALPFIFLTAKIEKKYERKSLGAKL